MCAWVGFVSGLDVWLGKGCARNPGLIGWIYGGIWLVGWVCGELCVCREVCCMGSWWCGM